MPNEKNAANAKRLLALAEAYALCQIELPEPGVLLFCWSKEELLDRMRALGGSWKKELSYGEDSMYLVSESLGLKLSIPRDKVCRKTVTWDCEPLFSPQDEQEIDAALIPVQDDPKSPVSEILTESDVPL